MKGAPPKLTSEEEAIHFYIGKYYKEYAKDPSIRFDIEKHLELIEEVNKTYQRDLKKHENFDYENYKDCFIECIDFLTKVISKKRLTAQQSETKKQFLKKIIN